MSASERNGGSAAQPSARREKIRVRIERLRLSRRRSSIIGIPEIIGLGVSALMLLAVTFAYFYFLLPANLRLAGAQDERDRLQRTIKVSTEGVRHSTDTQAALAEITQSLQDFEMNHLAHRSTGRVELLDRLNRIIRANGLRNTAGPTYSPLEAIDPNAPKSSQTRSGSAKLQSVYPGIGVSVTVEGPYANVRRFVRDIEASNQFIVINSVELESVTDTNAAPPPAAVEGETPGVAPQPGVPRSNLVSLRVNMAAYFQRESSQAAGDEGGATP